LDYAAITIEADLVEGRRIAWYVPGLARRLASVRKPSHHAFSFQAIQKIANAHASTGATKNPDISQGEELQ
jgi:hypothetical protein